MTRVLGGGGRDIGGDVSGGSVAVRIPTAYIGMVTGPNTWVPSHDTGGRFRTCHIVSV
jgi:hypothetical protein